jgi:hypothetical protein
MRRWLFIHGVISLAILHACGGEVAGDDPGRSGDSVGGTGRGLGSGGVRIGLGGGDVGSGGVPVAVGGGGVATLGGTGGTDICAQVDTYMPIWIQPVVEFVVDTGASMAESDVPSTGGRTKWAVTHEILLPTFLSFPSRWAVGVTYFNLPDADAAYRGVQAVPIAPLTSTQIATIVASLNAVAPAGRTPTEAAWQYGLAQVLSWSSPAPEYLASPRYLVLVTDSVPTVNRDGTTPGSGMNGSIDQAEYDHLIQTIGEGFVQNYVKTFVVGVPGSEDPEGASYDPLYQLSRIAVAAGSGLANCTPLPGSVVECYDTAAGRPSTCLANRGTYCHIELTTNSDLPGLLMAAIGSLSIADGTCAFLIPPTSSDGRAVDPNGVTITYTPLGGPPQTFARSLSDCSTGDWYFSMFDSNMEPTMLTLCPNTCAVFNGSEGARLHIAFTCLDG